MLVAAVRESGVGTQQARAYAAVCPVLAEADVRPLDGNSGFDPTETLAVGIFAVQFDATRFVHRHFLL
jgi:hypothetical protein